MAQIVSAQTHGSLYDIPLKDIDGKDTSLKAYQGKVLLIVNVASKCGFTPQYEGLEALQKKYEAQGFTVLGFPCNDFLSQEPGTAEEIKTFCSTKYNVTFPLFEKLHVKGKEQHPLYAALTGDSSPFPGSIKWNFGKFVISRDGKIFKRFGSTDKPESPEVTGAIETALAAK
jgi:glutathione peroxidase